MVKEHELKRYARVDRLIQDNTRDGELTVPCRKIAESANVPIGLVWRRANKLGVRCKRQWGRTKLDKPDYKEYVEITCPECKGKHLRSRGYIRDLIEENKPPHCSECKERLARIRLRAIAEEHILKNPPKRIKILWSLHHTFGRGEVKTGPLIVGVWQEWPTAFGLKGYEAEYPDSNRIIMELVKLVREELVSRPAPVTYKITDKGSALLEKFGNVPEANGRKLPETQEVNGQI